MFCSKGLPQARVSYVSLPHNNSLHSLAQSLADFTVSSLGSTFLCLANLDNAQSLVPAFYFGIVRSVAY